MKAEKFTLWPAIPQAKNFGLWSTWDMLRFYADRFIALAQFAELAKFFLDSYQKKPNFQLPSNAALDIKKKMTEAAILCDEIGLPLTKITAILICEKLSKTTSPIGLDIDLREFIHRLHDELSLRYVMLLPEEKAKFFEPKEPLFGPKVSDKFTSASFDIDESGKCYALGRGTACVFHLMCVLDIGLTKLCEMLKVQDPKANWGAIFKQLEEKIRVMPDTKNPEDEKTYYSAALAHLYNVKDAWRNHVSHGREKYTEEEALGIYNSVRSFMMGFAERLSK